MEECASPETHQDGCESPRFFLSYREQKTPIAKQLKRPAYENNFYLRDNKGRDVLAVTGEDQGGCRRARLPLFLVPFLLSPGPLMSSH